jgi:hypothetical protein
MLSSKYVIAHPGRRMNSGEIKIKQLQKYSFLAPNWMFFEPLYRRFTKVSFITLIMNGWVRVQFGLPLIGSRNRTIIEPLIARFTNILSYLKSVRAQYRDGIEAPQT